MPLRVLLFGSLFFACRFSGADGLPAFVTPPAVPTSIHVAFISGAIFPAISTTTAQTAGSSFISSKIEDGGFRTESTIPQSSALPKGGSASVTASIVKPSQQITLASIGAYSTSRALPTAVPTSSSTTCASAVRVNVRQVVGFSVFLLMALCYVAVFLGKRAAAVGRGGSGQYAAGASQRATPMSADVELQPRPGRVHGRSLRPSAVLTQARRSVSTLPVYVAAPTALTALPARFTMNTMTDLPPSYAEHAPGGASTGAILEAGVGNRVVYEEPEEMDSRTI